MREQMRPRFICYVGVDYSGAGEPDRRRAGLQLFEAHGIEPPERIGPSRLPKKGFHFVCGDYKQGRSHLRDVLAGFSCPGSGPRGAFFAPSGTLRAHHPLCRSRRRGESGLYSPSVEQLGHPLVFWATWGVTRRLRMALTQSRVS